MGSKPTCKGVGKRRIQTRVCAGRRCAWRLPAMCPRAPALRGRGHRIRVPAPRQPTRGPGDAERHRLGYGRTAVSRDARHVAGPICPECPPAARPRPRLPHPPDLGLSEALMPVHLGGHAPIRPAYCWVTDLPDHPPITVQCIHARTRGYTLFLALIFSLYCGRLSAEERRRYSYD